MTTRLPKRSEIRRPCIGRVTLVGAGPGDAELLTLKAMRVLQSADVILFDALVSDDVLELARRDAKRMLVGKRGHRLSCKQGDINALMLKLARQGKHVVRLKAGDPVIFGRAGEEIAELEANGIEVTIVPGITSASAMAATLGISLTHRDHAHSVRFVTGHAKDGARVSRSRTPTSNATTGRSGTNGWISTCSRRSRRCRTTPRNGSKLTTTTAPT